MIVLIDFFFFSNADKMVLFPVVEDQLQLPQCMMVLSFKRYFSFSSQVDYMFCQVIVTWIYMFVFLFQFLKSFYFVEKSVLSCIVKKIMQFQYFFLNFIEIVGECHWKLSYLEGIDSNWHYVPF